MNRIDDYLPEELLAMSDEEIDRLVDVESAHLGIPLLPPRPVEPEPAPATPDVTVYEAAGHLFRDKADAQKVCDLLKSLPVLETYSVNNEGYSWRGPFGVRLNEDFDIAPHEVKHWTAEHYDRHRRALETAKEAKERYSEAKSEYDKILSQRGEIVERIAAIRSAEQSRQDRRARIAADFERYVELADGDRDQALTFYLHANDDQGEDLVRDVVGMPGDEI